MKNPKNIIFYLIILILAIIPFWKTGISGYIDKTDTTFPTYPNTTLYTSCYVWSDYYLGTDLSTLIPPKIVVYGIITLINNLGFHAEIINRLMFVSSLLILGLGTFLLIKMLFRKQDTNDPNDDLPVNLSALAGATLAIYNPQIMFHLLHGHLDILFVLAFYPLFLILFIQSLETKKIQYSLYMGLLSLLFGFSNATIFGLILILSIIFFLFYLFISEKKSRIRVLIQTLLNIFVIIIFNLWWLIPSINKLIVLKEAMWDQNNDFLSMVNLENTYHNLVRLLGFTLQYSVYPFLEFFRNISFSISSWLIFTLVCLGTIFTICQKKIKYGIFFLIITFLSLILSAGVHPPLGKIYLWLWNNLPFFNYYRDPTKWSLWLIISYPILLGVFFYWVFLKIRSKSISIIIALSIIIVLLFNTKPLISGNLENNLAPVKIPDYYQSVKNWSDNLSNYPRVLVTPSYNWYSKYTWSDYNLTDIMNVIIPQSIVNKFAIGPANKISSNAIEDIYYNLYYQENFVPLRLSSINYVLVRDDIEYRKNIEGIKGETKQNPNKYDEILAKQSQLIENFGNIRIYSIDNSMPLVYIPNEILVANSADDYGIIYQTINQKLANNQNLTYKPAIIEGINSIKLKINGIIKNPKLEFKKINPTKYEINIQSAKNPYLLNLLTSFSPSWKAEIYQDNKKILINEQNHFIVNKFANSWYIDEPGDYKINIFYQPQKLLYIGAIISLSSIILLAVFILIKYFRKK